MQIVLSNPFITGVLSVFNIGRISTSVFHQRFRKIPLTRSRCLRSDENRSQIYPISSTFSKYLKSKQFFFFCKSNRIPPRANVLLIEFQHFRCVFLGAYMLGLELKFFIFVGTCVLNFIEY